jgi:hypothetical protein
MKHRTTIAAIAAAAAIGAACAFLVPAASASAGASAGEAAGASATTGTLRFTSVAVTQADYTATVSSAQDNDVNKAGKVIGYDLLHVVFNPTARTAAVDVVFVNQAGFVYGVATASNSPVLHGTVTGGTGSFKGATGTFVAKNLNSAGTKAAVTITYRT